MGMVVKTGRRRPAGIGDDQTASGFEPVEPGIGSLPQRRPLHLRSGQDEIGQHPVLFDRIVEEREAPVAVPKQAQHRRHPFDRRLQGRRRLEPGRPQCRPNIDEIAQDLKLQRGVARAVAAIGKNLHRRLALERPQRPGYARCRAAEGGEPANQSLECTQPRRTGTLPRRRAPEMTQLRRQAGRHRIAHRLVFAAPQNLGEMREPSAEPRRQHVGPPRQFMPVAVFQDPAAQQLARRPPPVLSGRGEVREPAEAVPCGQPFRTGGGGKPARGGIADRHAGQFDLAGGDRRTAFVVARPSLRDLGHQVGGHAPAQGVAIEPVADEPVQRALSHPRRRRSRIANRAARSPAPRSPHPAAARTRRRAGGTSHAAPDARPIGNLMPSRNKERGSPQAALRGSPPLDEPGREEAVEAVVLG